MSDSNRPVNLDSNLADLGNDDFKSFFDQYLSDSDIREQSVVTGRVLSIEGDWVTVDVGYKAEGVIPVAEFIDENGNLTIKEGDEVHVFLDQMGEEDGQLTLSKRKADEMKAWEDISQAYEKDQVVTGAVTGFTGESVELASPTPDATCTPCTAPCTATWSGPKIRVS